MIKKMMLIFFSIIAAAIAIFFAFRNQEQIQYRTVKVIKGNLTPSVSATGRVIPTVLVNVGSQITGTIKKIYVDFNDKVKKDQLLIELDQDIYRARVLEAEANVESAKAQLNKAKAELANQEADYNRLKDLFDKGFISKSEYDATAYSYESARALFEAANSSLKNAQANLDVAMANLDKTVIRSPINGIVLSLDVEEGQTVSASLQAPTLLSVGNLNEMEIHVSVDEADIGRVKEGMKVVFYVDSYPDKEFDGAVHKMHYSAKIEQNVVTYNTIIKVKNDDLLLRPGMTANVKIIIDTKKDVLLIPNKALRVRFPDETQIKGHSVWILQNNKPVKKTVKLGLSDNDNTEVIEGLTEGDIVIIESPQIKEKRSMPFGGRI